jgi:hypothetical protein
LHEYLDNNEAAYIFDSIANVYESTSYTRAKYVTRRPRMRQRLYCCKCTRSQRCCTCGHLHQGYETCSQIHKNEYVKALATPTLQDLLIRASVSISDIHSTIGRLSIEGHQLLWCIHQRFTGQESLYSFAIERTDTENENLRAVQILYNPRLTLEEHVFSSIGIIVSKQRNRIYIVTLEHFESFEVTVKVKRIAIFGEFGIVGGDRGNIALGR